MSNNTDVARKAMYELFNNRDLAAVDRYFAEDYIQHNPGVPAGLDGLRSIVPNLAVKFEYEMIRTFEDDDHVIAMSRIKGFYPDEDAAVVDIFRFENGRIAEHWDVIQPYTPDNQTASGNPMLS
ncbi:putative integron gene cassette protein [Streptomyces hygroscopicus subsp. jinggangensis 5008]|nr:putative integron gene cassette protein [Streptomyces hygroscopicus subsp. jinggangensis 5008]